MGPLRKLFQRNDFDDQYLTRQPVDMLSWKILVPVVGLMTGAAFMTQKDDPFENYPKEERDMMSITAQNEHLVCPVPGSGPEDIREMLAASMDRITTSIAVRPEFAMFEPGEHDVGPADRIMIDHAVASFRDREDMMIIVYGCTDSKLHKGVTKEESLIYDAHLRELRADAVANIVKKHIPEERVCTITECTNFLRVGVVKAISLEEFNAEGAPPVTEEPIQKPVKEPVNFSPTEPPIDLSF